MSPLYFGFLLHQMWICKIEIRIISIMLMSTYQSLIIFIILNFSFQSNVANVVVGDFQLAGHDQILLMKCPSSYKPGPFLLEEFLNSIYITDFKRFGFVGPSDQQQELKFSGMNSMTKAYSKNKLACNCTFLLQWFMVSIFCLHCFLNLSNV